MTTEWVTKGLASVLDSPKTYLLPVIGFFLTLDSSPVKWRAGPDKGFKKSSIASLKREGVGPLHLPCFNLRSISILDFHVRFYLKINLPLKYIGEPTGLDKL